MDGFAQHAVGVGLAVIGALVSEALRRRAAIEKLAQDMQARVLLGRDALAERTLVYPKGYATSVAIYAFAAGGASLGLPSVTNPIFFLYIGLSLPHFMKAIIGFAEPALPGAVKPGDGSPLTGDSRNIGTDDTALGRNSLSVKKVGAGRYRMANGLFRYLAS